MISPAHESVLCGLFFKVPVLYINYITDPAMAVRTDIQTARQTEKTTETLRFRRLSAPYLCISVAYVYFVPP